MQALGAQRMPLPLTQPPEPGRHAQGAPTVMIVEDEALIAFSLEDIFGDEGYAIAGPFSSCASALRSLRARSRS